MIYALIVLGIIAENFNDIGFRKLNNIQIYDASYHDDVNSKRFYLIEEIDKAISEECSSYNLFALNLERIIVLNEISQSNFKISSHFRRNSQVPDLNELLLELFKTNMLNQEEYEDFNSFIEQNDFKELSYFNPIKNLEKNQFLFSNMILNSYIKLQTKNSKEFSQNIDCNNYLDCYISCIDNYTYTSDWWFDFHIGYDISLSKGLNNDPVKYAFYFAEAYGLSKCEYNNCNKFSIEPSRDLAIMN